MPQLPCSGDISLPATTNGIVWTAIIADRDYFILEADVAPGPNAAGNVQCLIGKVQSASDFPSPLTAGNGTQTQTSTNKTFPTKYLEIWVGDISKAPPLVTLQVTVNQEYKNMLGAIPLAHPPLVHRGEVLIIGAKNLGGAAVHVTWNINACAVSGYARGLIEQYLGGGQPSGRPTAIGDMAPQPS